MDASITEKKILVIGANGFIGNALSRRLLSYPQYKVYGVDLYSSNIEDLMDNPNFHFQIADIRKDRNAIDHLIALCDVVLPLVAIPTPNAYINNPMEVFELDFEENFRILRIVAKENKRIIFPSTSEVYGMCPDEFFDEDNSTLVLGPIHNQRWIYACSKQMLDRIIWAMGEKGLQFTLFRPFNWIGPRLDSLQGAKKRNARVLTQMIFSLTEGSPIYLVDGGRQKRCFLNIDDGIECLVRIIENKDNLCNRRIINIGNPNNEISIRQLAEMLISCYEKHPLSHRYPAPAGIKEIQSDHFYGKGYQDCLHRKPNIQTAWETCGWTPKIGVEETINKTLDYFLK